MNDLEVGLNENYQKLQKSDEDHKEDLHLDNHLTVLDSPPSSITELLAPNILLPPMAKRSSQQIKALVYKNLSLQSRQIGTNILQVFFLYNKKNSLETFIKDYNPADLFSFNSRY